MNGLAVDPGSNGSVSTVADVCRGSSRRLAIARISPVCGSRMTMSPPSAPMRATASASDFSAISCRSALIVSTTLSPATGGVPGVVGDSRLCPRESRIIVAAPAVPLRIESSDSSNPSTGLIVEVHVAEDPLRSLRHRVRACDRRVRVHAAQRNRRRGVDGEESPGNGEILGARVDGARNHSALDAELRQRDAELARLVHFARRDLESHHLAALGQHAVRRVEDLAARRGHDAIARLLAFGTRAPRAAVHQLHARRFHEDGDGKHGERRVREADAV